MDELENRINKELVRMITNVFKNERINKHGAQGQHLHHTPQSNRCLYRTAELRIRGQAKRCQEERYNPPPAALRRTLPSA